MLQEPGTHTGVHKRGSHAGPRVPGEGPRTPQWLVADEPSLHLGPGHRASDRARRASRKQICRWLWDQEPSAGVGMSSRGPRGVLVNTFMLVRVFL